MGSLFGGFTARSRPSRRLQRVREVRVDSVAHSESPRGLLGPIFGPNSEKWVRLLKCLDFASGPKCAKYCVRQVFGDHSSGVTSYRQTRVGPACGGSERSTWADQKGARLVFFCWKAKALLGDRKGGPPGSFSSRTAHICSRNQVLATDWRRFGMCHTPLVTSVA